MSDGSWVSTGSDALTAIAAVAGAGVGGAWAYFRYHRQAPDVPRVNASVEATAFTEDDNDYLSIGVRLEHMAGGIVKIRRDAAADPNEPTVEFGDWLAPATQAWSKAKS